MTRVNFPPGELLLRRRPICMDLAPVQREISGKTVLVTGAAGSIGSALCHQLSEFGIERLVALDRSEYGLYRLCQALKNEGRKVPFTPVLADIGDESQIASVFREHHPYLVLHAAAYKHLPFIELFPEATVINNIFGTQTLVQLANTYSTERFLMISTDKAIRPTSVLGATKRVAEMIVQAIGTQSPTRFMTVRFGNVLWSEGSVAEIFTERIRRRLPLLVTHPESERYFITIGEAVQLSLLAGVLGRSEEIYILEMGSPIRIADLAAELIRLTGLIPGKDVPIEYTRLRPGEKLTEEVLRQGEDFTETLCERILVARSNPVEWSILKTQLDALRDLVFAGNGEAIKTHLAEIVQDYRPYVSTLSPFDV